MGQQSSLLSYVQPYSGTAPSTTLAALKHSEAGSEKNANTIPSVGLPFGMTQWVAQTRKTEQKCLPPYYYKDTLLSGFRATHWISGSCTQDYGSFTIFPMTGGVQPDHKGLRFSHINEIVTPSYYAVKLQDFNVAMTASVRCGIWQCTMLKEDSLFLLISPNSDQGKGFVQIDTAANVIWGYNPVHRIYQGWGQPAGFNGWFYIQFDRAIQVRGVFQDNALKNSDSIGGRINVGAYVGFRLKKGETLSLRIGTSFSSLQGAQQNLDAELGRRTFQQVRQLANASWEQAFTRMNVQTTQVLRKKIFYTALYHALQHPRIMNDVDGTYPQFAGSYQLQRSGKRNYYDDFSMWDIYRAQLPLLSILEPKRTNDFVYSMIEKGKQGGWLPIFPCWNSYTSAMIGDHVTAFIASAYNKGLRNYDVQEAYRLMHQNAFVIAGPADYVNGLGRRAMDSYLKYHYIPLEDSVPIAFHKKEQVSRTLEYSYDDYALYTFAKALGKKKDAALLRQRAMNYQRIFDPAVGMMNGKYADGSFFKKFDADKRDFFITEGTPRQYTFYVPQDIPGLATLMGGREHFEAALDSLFQKGEYWHGNEPGHQIPFLYNYTAHPWKSQQIVQKIVLEEYSDGPGGLSGNDDAGQMSAWLLFASIGFYPVDPVSGNYLLTAPIFDQIALKTSASRSFTMDVHRSTPDAGYIASVRWNGKPYLKNYITHAMIVRGGHLQINLVKEPTSWGSVVSQQPQGLQ